MSVSAELMHGSLKGLLLGGWAAGSYLLLVFLFQGINSMVRQRKRFRSFGIRSSPRRGTWASITQLKPVKHLAEEMEVADMKIGVEVVMAFMLLIGLTGFFGSDAAMGLLQQRYAYGVISAPGYHVWTLSGAVAILLGSLPYFYVRFRVQHKRHRIALRMIMLVQNLIGHYRPSLTLADIIVKSSRTMPDEVKSEWRRLELALHMKPVDEALYEFARRVQSEWADDLADLLLIGAHYGTDMTESLHHLVSRMQTAKRNEENRLAMITVYRLGTSFMIGFAFFVVGFNIYADAANYSHYFLNPGGKMLLIVSFAVMFVSMLLVVRSGRKAF